MRGRRTTHKKAAATRCQALCDPLNGYSFTHACIRARMVAKALLPTDVQGLMRLWI